jgi:hypothetical protein
VHLAMKMPRGRAIRYHSDVQKAGWPVFVKRFF